MPLISKNSKKQDENKAENFYDYIRKIHSATTVNGREVKNKFSWYRKVLGLL